MNQINIHYGNENSVQCPPMAMKNGLNFPVHKLKAILGKLKKKRTRRKTSAEVESLSIDTNMN